jgi:dinuclear metal center protein, YbgI family
MRLREIIGELETLYHPKIAEDWDNVGLLIGDENRDINKMLFCLDLTEKAVDEAIEKGVDLIISHHPAIFSGMKRITTENLQGRKVLKLIENKIAVYSIHTNCDFAVNGLNDFVFEKLELNGNVEIVNQYEFDEYNFRKNRIDRIRGGSVRIKTLDHEITLQVLVEKIKYHLGLDYVRFVGDKNRKIRRIGLVTGGGSSFMHDIKDRIDVFLTGDLRHHESLDALEEGGLLVDIGHYESEYLFADLMEREISRFFDGEMIKYFGEEVFQLG